LAEQHKETEYWRWTESRWVNPKIHWKSGGAICAGVDVGSVSTQAVVLVNDSIYCYSSMRTGSDSPESAHNALKWAIDGTGLTLDKIQTTVGTGYGRVNVPFADKAITEIACHARGGNFIYGPRLRTILDMGGQDCKAIRCDEKGKVTGFLMNDKCAAGTGRGMEVFADIVGVHINEVGEMSLRVGEDPPPVSSTCVVFAKSEASSLLRQGWQKEKVLAAYCSAMAHRVAMLLMQVGIEQEFAITGGIAKNIGIVSRISKELNVTPLKSDIDPQIAGALGAALFAKTLFEKKNRS
jgi:bzd-type benzoyl-CoA reductase Q subunit